MGKEGLVFGLENYESQSPGERLARCTSDNMASDASEKLEFFRVKGEGKARAPCVCP